MVSKKIASFDPASFRNLGWAIFSFVDKKKSKAACRAGTFIGTQPEYGPASLWEFFEIIDEFLKNEKPDIVILEKTSSFAGGFVTGQVSGCIAVIMALCGKHKIPTDSVFPTHVKKVVTGSGKAKKGLIKQSVIAILDDLKCHDFQADSGHAFDAISNIFCWLIDNEEYSLSCDIEKLREKTQKTKKVKKKK